MQIYGYTDERNTFACDFSAREVLRLGVLPYGLDLCETAPRVVECNGKMLNFSPLKKFGFLIEEARGPGSRVHVCIINENQRIRFSGTVSKFFDRARHLTDIAPCSLSVEELFERLDADSRHPLGHPLAWLVDPDSVSSQGDVVAVNISNVKYRFFGNMHEGSHFSHDTPEAVNWLFDTFTDGRPVVHGRSLTDGLLGIEPTEVRVYLDRQYLYKVADILKQHGVSVSSNAPDGGQVLFEHRGVQYIARRTEFFMPQSVSIDQICCIEKNRMTASWIALFDLERKQGREAHEMMALSPDYEFLRKLKKLPKGFTETIPRRIVDV